MLLIPARCTQLMDNLALHRRNTDAWFKIKVMYLRRSVVNQRKIKGGKSRRFLEVDSVG